MTLLLRLGADGKPVQRFIDMVDHILPNVSTGAGAPAPAPAPATASAAAAASVASSGDAMLPECVHNESVRGRMRVFMMTCGDSCDRCSMVCCCCCCCLCLCVSVRVCACLCVSVCVVDDWRVLACVFLLNVYVCGMNTCRHIYNFHVVTVPVIAGRVST